MNYDEITPQKIDDDDDDDFSLFFFTPSFLCFSKH